MLCEEYLFALVCENLLVSQDRSGCAASLRQRAERAGRARRVRYQQLQLVG